MYKRFALVVLFSSLFLQAVIVINNHTQSIIIAGFSFLDKREIGKFPVTVQPGHRWEYNGLSSFTINETNGAFTKNYHFSDEKSSRESVIIIDQELITKN